MNLKWKNKTAVLTVLEVWRSEGITRAVVCPVFNQEKASSAVTSGHFEMYFIFFLLISQLDSFLCDVLEGPYS